MQGWSDDFLAEAVRIRRLAHDARRMADLMHQPDVKRSLLAQATQLERQADNMERQAGATGDGLAERPWLRLVH
jgi:hypothetical protein